MFSRFKGENIPALPGRFFETVQGVSKETNNQVSPNSVWSQWVCTVDGVVVPQLSSTCSPHLASLCAAKKHLKSGRRAICGLGAPSETIVAMSQSGRERTLEERVVRAAESALSRQNYVGAIDVLCGMGLVRFSQVDSWRKGRIDFLERVIQGNLTKISSSKAIFRRWALEKGLKPSETGYVRRTRSGTLPLQFSKSGDPAIEKNYRTHYVSAALTERKQQSLEQKLGRAPQPAVFEIVRESECSECGVEMPQGSLLFMEAEEPLCMQCAGFGDLEYLAAGDTALTRRATKYSERIAVVVRFSRSRKRYERQGILVEIAAIEKAERECAEDADERVAARVREAERRQGADRNLVIRMKEQIHQLFPGCLTQELAAIAAHTSKRGSGRVGRTQAGRNLEEEALLAAVRAAIRHSHTGYDEMLLRGIDRMTARQNVADQIEKILAAWRRSAPTP